MTIPFDLYADAFSVSITLFGANLSFELKEPHPSSTTPLQTVRLGTIRMSREHLKVMVMMIRNQIRLSEAQTSKIEIPSALLVQLGIAPEDW